MFLQLALILCVSLILVDFLKCKRKEKLHRECGTYYRYIPIVGHAYKFIGNKEDVMDLLKDLSHSSYRTKHGISSLWMGPKLFLYVCNADAASVLLKCALDKGSLQHTSRHLLGNGIIFAPVDVWRNRRKAMGPYFKTKTMNNLIKVFESNSNSMIDQLKDEVGKGDFSLWPFLSTYTLTSAIETTFGEKLDLMPDHPFVKAFVTYLDHASCRLFQPWLYNETIYRMFPVFRKQCQLKEVLTKVTDNLISNIRKLKSEEENNRLKRRTSLKSTVEELIDVTGGNNGYTNLELREEAMSVIIAATDTTATTACLTLVLLSLYPAVQDKVYKEIYEIFGTSDRPITRDDVSNLKYMEAVINESMRLYPPVPMILRKTDCDIKLPSCLVISKDTDFVTSIWGIHHNPKYWGADVENFIPERFLNGVPNQQGVFIPFSYSFRNCLGQRYAMNALKTCFTTLLRKYRLIPATSFRYDGDNPLRIKYDIILKHVDNFKVRLEYRI